MVGARTSTGSLYGGINTATFIPLAEETGLIRPQNVTPELSATGQITVSDAEGEMRTVNLTDVQLQPLLAPSGLLHGRWALFPNLLPIRNELEYWLRFISPETLFYDDEATQDARLKASADEDEVRDFYKVGNLLVKPGESIDEARLASHAPKCADR